MGCHDIATCVQVVPMLRDQPWPLSRASLAPALVRIHQQHQSVIPLSTPSCSSVVCGWPLYQSACQRESATVSVSQRDFSTPPCPVSAWPSKHWAPPTPRPRIPSPNRPSPRPRGKKPSASFASSGRHSNTAWPTLARLARLAHSVQLGTAGAVGAGAAGAAGGSGFSNRWLARRTCRPARMLACVCVASCRSDSKRRT